MDQQKRSRSLYMTEEAHRMLRRLAESWGVSENQATERAIREAHQGINQSGAEAPPDEELVEELRDQVQYLRGQVKVRDEEIRRRDHLMAAALERIPALEAKSEDPEATESNLRAFGEGLRGPGRGDSGGSASGAESGGWWKRLLGRD